MTTDGFFEFCGSAFWNSSVTWGSDDDSWLEFTQCFENSILIWGPSAWLLFTAPLYIYYLYQNAQTKRHLTTRNVVKSTIALLQALLIFLVIAQKFLSSGEDAPPVFFFSNSLRIFCYVVTIIIIQVERFKGAITSPTLFIYWLFTVIAEIIPFYSNILQNQENSDLVNFVLFYIYYGFLLIQLVLSALVEKSEETEHLCPEDKASVPSFLLFHWIHNVLWLSYKGKLKDSDIPELPIKNQSQILIADFDLHWDKEVKRCEKAKKKKKPENLIVSTEREFSAFNESTPLLGKYASFDDKYSGEKKKSSLLDDSNKDPYAPSLIRTLFSNFSGSFMLAFLCRMLSDIILFLNPLLLNLLIAFTDSDDPLWKGFVLAVCLALVRIVDVFILTQFERLNQTACMKMKYALICAIYKKSLRLSSEAKRRFTTGEIVNLMSVDCERIDERMQILWILLSSPLQISISLYFLYQILGVSAFAGLGIILGFIPLNLLMTRYMGTFAMAQMKVKDNRLNVFGEVLNGIKVLKLYAWEASFEDKIKNIRQSEMNLLKKSSFFLAVLWFIWTTSPFLVMLASFASYVMTSGNALTAQTAFVSQALFNMMRIPMNLLPEMFINLAECYVSLKRLRTYFNAEEINPNNVLYGAFEAKPVVIDNGTFSWDKTEDSVLQGIDISISEGSLVAVVGQVGSGKSSLLSCILGDMNKSYGNVYVKGSIAYVPQEAWIQNATIKDNILFGCPYIKKKYEKVINACQLTRDLEILPGGDMTEIGEKGINLSGGQKHRISLARAVYSDADIYLMDSPLSAVDANVGKEIFDNVISSTGLLKRKTRIWVTNAIQWLPQVDTIVVMSGGFITDMGPYETLVNKRGQFSEFLNTYMFHQTDSNDEEQENPQSPVDKLSRQVSAISDTSESSIISHRSSKNVEATGRLTEEEFKEEGSVKMSLYFAYFKAMGLGFTAGMVINMTLYQISEVGASLLLTDWTNDPFLTNSSTWNNTSEYTHLTNKYLTEYSLFGLSQAFFILLFSFSGAFAYVRASFRLHNNMLYSVLRTPLSFFDTTPMGRITNRFSQDMDTIDNALRDQMNTVFQTVFTIMSSVVIIAYSIPVFAGLLIPLTICYVSLLYFYIPTARELERINSVTRSPIFNHFSETLSGAASIRAYGASERFIQLSQERVNNNIKPFYCLVLANEWMTLRLQTISAVLVFSACVAGIMSRGSLNGALLGMALNYSFEITQILAWLLNTLVQFQTSFISVERVIEFCNLKSEASWNMNDDDVDPSWPKNGNVEFKDYRTRYRPGLELVLKGINCYVNSGEKVGVVGRTGAGKSSLTLALFRIIEVGVVGRTGAGKSSLTLALFRIIEASDGSILVDGKNIANMGLHDLRSKLTIFPQDPVLFSGSIRSNLDPFMAYSDRDIWRALEHAHLIDYIRRQSGGLEYECGENGQNLSMGQKQLVCLARALLHKTKLLVLDEATAAVDLETDSLIQQTIREEFSNCTILTIAHRLKTILDYDRIMVLDQGFIMEFDTPDNLLMDQRSRFYQMARDAGCI